MTLSAFTIEALLNYSFGQTVIVWPIRGRVGMIFYPVDPTEYLRLGIPVPPPVYYGGTFSAGSDNWISDSAGRITNNGKIRFKVASQDFLVTHMGLAATDVDGYNAITAWGPLATPTLVEEGKRAFFADGALGITLI